MINQSIKTFLLSFILLVIPSIASAGLIEDVYLFWNSSSSLSGGSSGTASIGGVVVPLDGVTDISTVLLGFKYRESPPVGGSFFLSNAFAPQASGQWSTVIGDDEQEDPKCNSFYDFFLYDESDVPTVPLILVDNSGYAPQNAFRLFINCGGYTPSFVPVPSGAGSLSGITGINWGYVVPSHNNIILNSSYLETSSGGPKSFKIQYGLHTQGVTPGNNPMTPGSTITLTAPYNFTRQIIGLSQDSEYWFNIREMSGGVETNLLVYGYAKTNTTANTAINYDFPTETSVHISGYIINDFDVALLEWPITVSLIADGPDGADGTTVIDSAMVNTGGSGFGTANPNGFFETTLTPIVPGDSYWIIIEDLNGNILTSPISFDADGTSGTGNDPGGNNPGGIGTVPPYNGLITCGHVMSNGLIDECDFNDLIMTINRVINFLIYYIAFPVVALVAAWAGIKLLTSGGDPGAKKDAKEMLGKVIKGLVLALLCWIIVKLILMILGYQGPLLEVMNLNSNYEAIE